MRPEKRWQLSVRFEETGPGRWVIRVRAAGEAERRFESLEGFYRYLVDRLKHRPGPGLR